MSTIPSDMRGLKIFIGDIRACKTPEKEQQRVDKEMAHIREKFAAKNLDAYGKKKYMWKLLYIYMLGYEVDIGHVEAMQLLASHTYTEKMAGYMACSILFNENSPLLRMIIQAIKNDLNGRDENYQCLALAVIANVGGQEFAESLTGDVQKLLIASQSSPVVRKKSALALLRLYRKYPDIIPQEGFAPKVLALMDDPNVTLGVLNSIASLLLGIVAHSPAGFEEGVPRAIRILGQLSFAKDIHLDYRYYQTICPWLQVKLLRFLQYFPPPGVDSEDMTKLNDVLHKILTKTEVTKSVNKNNADHGILFEAINLIIHMCMHGHKDLHGQAVGLIGKFITVREPNIRYLGLDAMARLTLVPGTLSNLKRHQNVINFSLNDPDVSIRKRAMDLMYYMCDKSNATEIVEEMMKHLEKAEFNLKEEFVLKIAILAEKYAKDLRWYIDTILQLIATAGDFISEDIWYRAVQVVTNNEDLQEYAATKIFNALKQPNIHENGIKVGGYILGEFGHQIKDDSITGERMLDAIHSHWTTCSLATKAILLSAYIKMANTFPQLKDKVNVVFQNNFGSADTEIQQRAIEYFSINQAAHDELMNTVFEIMPNFPERESVLLKRVKKTVKSAVELTKAAEEKQDEHKAEEKADDSGSEDMSDHEDDHQHQPHPHDNEEQKAKDMAPPQDLLGVFDTSTFSPVSPRSSFPAQDSSVVGKLIGKGSGVVYDSKLLQIGMKLMPGPAPQLKMILYYGNRGDSAITNLTLSLVDEAQGLKLQKKPEDALEVGGKQQVPHYLLWTLVKPFQDVPKIALSFNYEGQPQQLTLKVPITITQFVVGWQQDAETFVSSWKKTPNAEVKVVQSPDIIDLDSMKKLVLENMNFSLVEGVEKDENNFSVSGNLSTNAKGPNGQNVILPCLLRCETKPNSKFVRITAHSGHRIVSTALIQALSIALGAESV